MFHYYSIYLNRKYLGSISALTENAARNYAYQMYGSPSAYSGYSRDSFTIVRDR